ncbi:MAG: two-component system response regulator AtoC [Myxococcota bacterium]|jgi:two-component system response regulator AtoC
MARILVVDDEEGIREFVADALEMDGHRCTTAPDGRAAADRLDRQAFDLLLTDLKMPGMDGLELLRKVKADQPDVEVIVLTAHGTVDVAVDAMKLGAFDFLQKPISGPGELRLLVKRALERRDLVLAGERAALDTPPKAQLTWGAPAMAPVVRALKKVARTNATVLLNGESGVGKEVAARAIHEMSPRGKGPFVAINCAALPEALLESELFGHEKGAFSGAVARRRGRVELAAGGTFFMDEVGELDPRLQAKLLRVLQEKQYQRVGGERTLEADVRWIAATNRDLPAMVAEGGFREDLYHRLAVFPVELPPLRERREDIPPLAELLLHDIAKDLGCGRFELTPAARETLAGRDWPGNVRALRNALERAAILADGNTLDAGDFGGVPGVSVTGPGPAASGGGTLEDLERAAITRALTQHDGHRKNAAAALGIGLRTLYDKLKKYGVE